MLAADRPVTDGAVASGPMSATKALVTGSTGFVGRHLVAHLTAMGDQVSGIDRAIDGLDITDAPAVSAAIADVGIPLGGLIPSDPGVTALDAEGRPFLLPTYGGIVYNVSVGDSAYGWLAANARRFGFLQRVIGAQKARHKRPFIQLEPVNCLRARATAQRQTS